MLIKAELNHTNVSNNHEFQKHTHKMLKIRQTVYKGHEVPGVVVLSHGLVLRMGLTSLHLSKKNYYDYSYHALSYVLPGRLRDPWGRMGIQTP